MRKYLVLLMAIQLLIAALGAADMDKIPSEATSAAPVTEATPTPDGKAGLAEALKRIGAEYDPALAGTVGALRWAGKLLDAYAADGQDPAGAEKAAGAYIAAHPDDDGLEARLLRLRMAALQIASGQDLGLVREPGRRQNVDWTAPEVEELFEALFRGALLPAEDLR